MVLELTPLDRPRNVYITIISNNTSLSVILKIGQQECAVFREPHIKVTWGTHTHRGKKGCATKQNISSARKRCNLISLQKASHLTEIVSQHCFPMQDFAKQGPVSII